MAGWEETAAKKRDSVNALIPQEWRLTKIPTANEQRNVTGDYIRQFLTPEEIKITETDVVGIALRTTSGEWKAVDVTRAFCHRAAIAHQLTNCLLEIFFEAALTRAAELDAHLATHKKPVGPLHGVPVSLKDQFHVRGVETSMGYVGWIGTFQGRKGTGRERRFESELTRELLSLGAVLYVKTSVPHTLMAGESVNNIMGYVENPAQRQLSAGGSSGGEGALVALRGSPLGFGTDIGGSVRIPASFNGLWGMRPSSGRLPYEGAANSMDGQSSVLSVVGPLATTAAAVQYAMKALLSTEPWQHDPLCVPIPWREGEEKQIADIVGSAGKLAFGVVRHDGACAPQPPVARAIEEVVQALTAQGHEVVDWEPTPPNPKVAEVAFAAFGQDGGKDVHSVFSMSGEPMANPIKGIVPPEPVAEKTASEINEMNVWKREVQKEYMEYWNGTAAKTTTGRPVDAVICPTAPYAAATRDGYLYYGYTVWVNSLDYSSVVMPVTVCDKNVDKKVGGEFKPVDDTDKKVQELYDPELYHGTPVNLQVVGRRFKEERTLAIASYISSVLERKV